MNYERPVARLQTSEGKRDTLVCIYHGQHEGRLLLANTVSVLILPDFRQNGNRIMTSTIEF